MKVLFLGVLLLLIATPGWSKDLRVDPVVVTSQGVVKGSWSSDGSYSQFSGIPFATVDPNNPFGDSLPGPQFTDIFEANIDNVFCPQIEMFSGNTYDTIDCLKINVYVPRAASSSNPLPVMVWIYGGGFKMGGGGSAEFGPQYLLKHDVIVVTINYRVGVYGFMCLDIPSVPGNTGLKDQRNGLRWVKQNIEAFGGDASQITVFGQSAGAMSLEFHILTPGSAGLFHKAILQSGSALVEQVVINSRPSAPIELAAVFNYTANSIEEALEFIKSVPPSQLVPAAEALGITFKPCIEKKFEGIESFITEYPNRILESGNYNNVPLIIGYTDAEQSGSYIAPKEDFFESLKTLFRDRMDGYFEFQSEKELIAVSNIVKQFYIGTKPISKDTAQGLVMFESDAHFVSPIERSIKYRLSTSSSPIYQYMFTYTSDSEENAHVFGATHGEDIQYVFDSFNSKGEKSPKDLLVSERMTTMWTNFAKYGNPTPSKTDIVDVMWPTVTQEREYLIIDEDLTIDTKPKHDYVAFWDLLFQCYGEYFREAWTSCQQCTDLS